MIRLGKMIEIGTGLAIAHCRLSVESSQVGEEISVHTDREKRFDKIPA